MPLNTFRKRNLDTSTDEKLDSMSANVTEIGHCSILTGARQV